MKCTICNTNIKGHYFTDVWEQSICANHRVEHCFSCGRFVRPADLHLADGRCFCSFCHPSIVIFPEHIAWVEKRVRTVLYSHGISNIPQNLSIHLVSPSDMANLTHSKQINLYQPGLTVTSRMTGLFLSRCNHTIYIFDYLPKIQFAGILAHEILHAWQNEEEISLTPPLVEGFCNVGSYIVYKSIGNKLSRHFIKRLEEDPDTVYGDGFRKVKEVYQKMGNLEQTINCLI